MIDKLKAALLPLVDALKLPRVPYIIVAGGKRRDVVTQAKYVDRGTSNVDADLSKIEGKIINDLATNDNIVHSALKPLPGNKSSLNGERITGYINFGASASTGLSESDAVKTWVLTLPKYYQKDVIFDVLFLADSRHRVSGYLYSDCNYGSVLDFSFVGNKTYIRDSGSWK